MYGNVIENCQNVPKRKITLIKFSGSLSNLFSIKLKRLQRSLPITWRNLCLDIEMIDHMAYFSTPSTFGELSISIIIFCNFLNFTEMS